MRTKLWAKKLARLSVLSVTLNIVVGISLIFVPTKIVNAFGNLGLAFHTPQEIVVQGETKSKIIRTDANILMVPLKLSNGKLSLTCQAILDTGASFSHIDPRLAQALNLNPDSRSATVYTNTISGLSVSSGMMPVTVTVLGQEAKNMPVVIKDLKVLDTSFLPFHASDPHCLLGQDFLQRYSLQIQGNEVKLKPLS